MTAPTPTALSATVEVAAPPARVWDLLADPTRMPELSPELRRAIVVGRGPVGVGTTVLGVNRRGLVAWPTTSRIVRFEPGRAVAWRTRESGATWVYELEPTTTGTAVTARRVLPAFGLATRVMGPFIGGAAGHDAELAEGLRTTLERMRAVVEG